MKIKKIEKINDMGVFSSFIWDENVFGTNREPVEFNRINVIYGRNYSGKTTLSRLFRFLEQKELPSEFIDAQFELSLDDGTVVSQSSINTSIFPVRVYNSDYRLENLAFLNDTTRDGKINAFAVLGADNVKISSAIEALELELGNATMGNESGLYLRRKQALETLALIQDEYNTAYKYLDKKKKEKATQATDSIKQQAAVFGVVTYNVPALERDIDTIVENEFHGLSEEDRNKYNDLINSEKKDLLAKVVKKDNKFSAFLEKGREIVCEKIGKSGKIGELLRDSLLNKWVHEGKCIHERENRGKCAFCGSEISPERWSQLRQHFDEESEKFKVKIEQFSNELTAYRDYINNVKVADTSQFYASLQKTAGEIISKLFIERDVHIEQIDSLLKQVDYKLNNITEDCQFVELDNNENELHASVERYNLLVDRTNLITYDKSKNVGNAREQLRLQEVYDFILSVDYFSKKEELKKLETDRDEKKNEVQRIESDIQSIISRIEENKALLQDVALGAKMVNHYLSMMEGFSIQLEPKSSEDGKQVYFKVVRNGVEARNLSEGECSIIAFCYFIARLNDKETINTNPIIYIDDPICSLYANHVFFVFSLIRSALIDKKLFSQLFISTHSIEFLKFMHRLTNIQPNSNRYDKAWFIVERVGQCSKLIAMPSYMRKYVTEFEYLFLQIFKCANAERIDDSNFETFYGFGNNARKFLELYTYFKRPGVSDKDVMKELFGEVVNAYLIDRFNNEFSHSQGVMERCALPVDYSEEKMIAQLIMEVVKKEDEEQYNALVNQVCG